MPEDTVKTVLMPFLVAPQDMAERIKVREIEDELIKQGKMEEKDRMVFENNSKMVALSSASYTFENLYKTYKDWTHKIYKPEEAGESSYFISQMGYESLPPDMIDTTIIEEARSSGGTSNSSFMREYCAQFTDGSDSYFSAKKMHLCTVPDGELPSSQVRGAPDKKYILGIDPSFSNSPSSDFFAMSLLEIDESNQQGILVHSYAVAGGDLKDHIDYLYYILTNFNVEMICIDNAGFQFIDSCNESELFTKAKLNLGFFKFDTNKEGIEYGKETRRVRREYNKESGKIVFKQIFVSDWLRKANEHLQACIDHKKIWFSSKTIANASEFNRQTAQSIPVKYTGAESLLDLIETQDDLIYSTKKQCALVEVKSTARGTQTFDLPQHLKRSTSINRARKDNYTTLMLANWALKCYYDVMKVDKESLNDTFNPIMIP